MSYEVDVINPFQTNVLFLYPLLMFLGGAETEN